MSSVAVLLHSVAHRWDSFWRHRLDLEGDTHLQEMEQIRARRVYLAHQAVLWQRIATRREQVLNTEKH